MKVRPKKQLATTFAATEKVARSLLASCFAWLCALQEARRHSPRVDLVAALAEAQRYQARHAQMYSDSACRPKASFPYALGAAVRAPSSLRRRVCDRYSHLPRHRDHLIRPRSRLAACVGEGRVFHKALVQDLTDSTEWVVSEAYTSQDKVWRCSGVAWPLPRACFWQRVSLLAAHRSPPSSCSGDPLHDVLRERRKEQGLRRLF